MQTATVTVTARSASGKTIPWPNVNPHMLARAENELLLLFGEPYTIDMQPCQKELTTSTEPQQLPTSWETSHSTHPTETKRVANVRARFCPAAL